MDAEVWTCFVICPRLLQSFAPAITLPSHFQPEPCWMLTFLRPSSVSSCCSNEALPKEVASTSQIPPSLTAMTHETQFPALA